MASFKTILDDIGLGLKKAFTIGTEVAKASEPFVDIAFPGVATLYNSTLTAVGNAETAAITAGAQNGTGAQKLAAVVTAITPIYTAYATSQGLPVPTLATITNYVSAVVATVNAIPSANV